MNPGKRQAPLFAILLPWPTASLQQRDWKRIESSYAQTTIRSCEARQF